MYKLLLSTLVLMFLLSCGDASKPKSDEFIIEGSFFNANEGTIVLEELTTETRLPIDSVRIKADGTFKFKVKAEEVGFYILKMNENNFVTLLIEPQEVLLINADARQITATYTIEGSAGSEKIRTLNNKLRENYARVDSLRDTFERSRYFDNFLSIKDSLDSVYVAIIINQKDFVTNFIDNNATSLASLIALYQSFGQQPLLSEEEDFRYFEKLADGLIGAYPNNPHSIDLYDRVQQIRTFLSERAEAVKRTEIGKTAPEIILNNIEGEPTALSSLRGKVVLVNFWAGWCAPCRQKNPELKRVYNKYKHRNFQVFAVSIDRDRSSWTGAINTDGLSEWVHVSDLMFWQSPVLKLYNVEGIPASYLINKEGVILEKDPDIQNLDRILKEIL